MAQTDKHQLPKFDAAAFEKLVEVLKEKKSLTLKFAERRTAIYTRHQFYKWRKFMQASMEDPTYLTDIILRVSSKDEEPAQLVFSSGFINESLREAFLRAGVDID